MTDNVKTFNKGGAIVKNAARGACFRRSAANVAAINVAQELGRFGVVIGHSDIEK